MGDWMYNPARPRNQQEDTMKITITALCVGAALLAGLLPAPALSADTEVFSATLLGDNEVPPINTDGKAEFRMEQMGTSITFSLTFSGLSTPLIVSHLHFAPTKVAGGVMIFLCGGGNQPPCPSATSGTITGTITADNVTGPVGQGINAGDLASALEAVREGSAYANMHTTKFPGGEIRGQVVRRKSDK
jgi:hypothetical protein